MTKVPAMPDGKADPDWDEVFIANCLYCGRFLAWPYFPVGMEWHHECEQVYLRRTHAY